jgi:hypothetical protein
MNKLFESWNRYLNEDKGPSRDEQLQAFLEDEPRVMDNWAQAIELDDDLYLDEVFYSLEDYFLPEQSAPEKAETIAAARGFLDRKMQEFKDKAVRDEITPEESMKQLFTEIIYILGLLRKHGSQGGVDAY